MPSSTPKTLTNFVEAMLKINPATMLDIGIGYSKNGFLAREYLCSWKNEVFPHQWTLKIEGVEIFKLYTELPWAKEIYDEIHIGEAQTICPKLFNDKKFDLITCTDVLEHMTKEVGMSLGEDMLLNANKGVIINVPTGNWLNNVVVANNPAEAHQAIWEETDLEELANITGLKIEKFPWSQNGRTGCMAVYRK